MLNGPIFQSENFKAYFSEARDLNATDSHVRELTIGKIALAWGEFTQFRQKATCQTFGGWRTQLTAPRKLKAILLHARVKSREILDQKTALS